MPTIHPLVRDLYKRALLVGKDYPHPDGMSYVRSQWKHAIRNKDNIPSYYKKVAKSTSCSSSAASAADASETAKIKETEMLKAIGKGRYMIREMMGVIQLKKYRTLKKRYNTTDTINLEEPPIINRKYVPNSSSQ